MPKSDVGIYSWLPDMPIQRGTFPEMKNIFFALVTIALATADASACSFPSLTLRQQIENVDQVFIATLLEAKLMPHDERHRGLWIEGRFQVTKVLKGGNLPGEITLTTGMGRGDCGVGMLVSSKYILFKRAKDTGISDADGSHIIEDFQENEIAAQIRSIMRRHQSKVKGD
jgi:hypothetical protein